MDEIQVALNELVVLKVVVDVIEDESMVVIDRDRLAQLGYTLIYDNDEPQFCLISDMQRFLYNVDLYLDDRIPYTSLTSYTTINVKADYSSF